MTGSSKIIAIVAVIVVVLVAVAAVSVVVMQGGKDEKTLTVATSPDFPNFSFLTGTYLRYLKDGHPFSG